MYKAAYQHQQCSSNRQITDTLNLEGHKLCLNDKAKNTKDTKIEQNITARPGYPIPLSYQCELVLKTCYLPLPPSCDDSTNSTTLQTLQRMTLLMAIN